MTRKTYVFMLTDEDRKRHEHYKDKGRITRFTVQYETLIDEKWMPVVRYDTAHGFAHKDLLNPDGTQEKIMIGETDWNEVLIMADEDILENWERYKERYFKKIK